MKSKSIALINEVGFNPTYNISTKQMLWLKYLSEKQNINIIHALNSVSEYKIGKYKVDGYDETTNTVYEFQGCWFHGCPICFNPKTINPFKQQTMETQYKKTKAKEEFIKSRYFNYVEIWENEWDDMVECSEELNYYIKNHKIKPPFNPRDALFGGRTNAARLY